VNQLGDRQLGDKSWATTNWATRVGSITRRQPRNIANTILISLVYHCLRSCYMHE